MKPTKSSNRFALSMAAVLVCAICSHGQSVQQIADLSTTIGRDILANPTPNLSRPPGLFIALDTPDPSNDATCFFDLTQPQSDTNPGALVASLGAINHLGYDPGSGSIYSVGGDTPYTVSTGWILRRTTDQAQSWSTVDSGWRLAAN